MKRDGSRTSTHHVATEQAFRYIPSVDRLLADAGVRAATTLDQGFLVQIIRDELQSIRLRIAQGEVLPAASAREFVIASVSRVERTRLGAVINGTGVIIHTNLGRAPVSLATGRAMRDAATRAVALEVDLDSGERGGRMDEISALMALLTGGEQTIVVNNNAAAVLLVLSALARGREVVVSRGEAVEIGGGFRIPDVLAQSGAELVEVGTTNRTYAKDYRDAVTERTACMLKVHPSNFEIRGFTHEATIAELALVGREHEIPVVEDLGSGALLDTAAFGLEAEPTIGERLRAGAAVVTASGDKLLGGPQAGIIVGRGALIDRIAAHPLARAVRADKTCLAGVAATLRHYARGEAAEQIPVWRMIAAPVANLEERASRLAEHLRSAGIGATSIQSVATVGGGSLPGQMLPSWGIAIDPPEGTTLDSVARRMRTGQKPVVPRVVDGQVVIDLRTVLPEDDELLADAVVHTLGRVDGSTAAQ